MLPSIPCYLVASPSWAICPSIWPIISSNILVSWWQPSMAASAEKSDPSPPVPATVERPPATSNKRPTAYNTTDDDRRHKNDGKTPTADGVRQMSQESQEPCLHWGYRSHGVTINIKTAVHSRFALCTSFACAAVR